MAFTAQDVKTLREQTGCGMMDCKKALSETDGDFDKAVEYLREKGLAQSAKKASRIAAEGMAFAVAHIDKKVGVVLEVNAETDFVAKNDMFRAFVSDVAEVIMDKNPADVATLSECIMPDGTTVEASRQDKVLVIGENIQIRRFERFEGACAAYVHGGGTHGVLVQFNTADAVAAKAEFSAYGKDIAMQIAAANPGYLTQTEVPAEVVQKEKDILLAQIENDPKLAGKPDPVKAKMVEGRIAKFYKENCLIEQQFVKDGELTIGQYTEKMGKELGGDIAIVKFVRFEKGEGLEKREDNFAEEIANMVK